MPFFGDESGDRPDPYRRMPFGVTPKVGESIHLRSQGNLSYLDFIRLLVQLWTEANPQIPLYATGPIMETVSYPNIVYSLEIRRPFENEPKAKVRETYKTDDDADEITVFAQRFNSIVSFKVYTQDDPQVAEEIIEVFEDFIVEYTPVFKQLGLSDIFYAQRQPDTMENRSGRNVIGRTVSYKVVTEKLTKSSAWKINDVLVDAQMFMKNTPASGISFDQATPHTVITDNDVGAIVSGNIYGWYSSATLGDNGEIVVTYTTPFGIDANTGEPYYDPGNVTSGEEAVLLEDLTLIQPGR